jgi:hypothetical protein
MATPTVAPAAWQQDLVRILGGGLERGLQDGIDRGITQGVAELGNLARTSIKDVRETVSYGGRTAAIVLLTIGLLALVIGTVLIAVFAMGFQEYQRDAEKGQSAWRFTATIFALLGGLLLLVLGSSAIAVSVFTFRFADRFGKV